MSTSRFRTSTEVPDSQAALVDLAVKARPQSNYDAPQGLLIPDTNPNTSLSQLSNALSHLNPRLAQVGVAIMSARERQEEAEALLASVETR
jgi:hypothetical protein